MRERRRLGRTGIEIAPIGLGTWQFSEGKGIAGRFWPSLAPARVDEIVAAALEGGIDWFDTAEVYGHGRSEAALARALRAAGREDGEVVIATKWWPAMRTARSIRRTIDERLARLGGFSIDLHQVHHPAALATVGAQMDAMADLVRAGRIRAVGVSNFGARRMRAAHAALEARGLSLASNQVKASLLDRRFERNGVLEAAREIGATIIAYSPLEQGLLTGKFHDDPDLVRGRAGYRRWMPGFWRRNLARSRPVVHTLREIGEAHGATPAQVALRWLVQFHGETVVAIPGATRARQARENAAAMALRLTDGELDRLDRVSRPRSWAPPGRGGGPRA